MTLFGKANPKPKRTRNREPRHSSTPYLNGHPSKSTRALGYAPDPSAPFHPSQVLAPGWKSTPTLHQQQDVVMRRPYCDTFPAEARYEGDMEWKLSTARPTAPYGVVRTTSDETSTRHNTCTEYLNRGAALYDLISAKLNSIITLIDEEKFSGDERELVVHQKPSLELRGGGPSRNMPRGANCAVSSAFTSTNSFSKANLYANSRLPKDLPPLRLYVSTYPLLGIAADYSERVYDKPSGSERETQVDADWRLGTKAMMIKSCPRDDLNLVVFAIRGSQTFMDWAVNLNSAPTSPEGFLDDPGNLCHAGFLSVARKMVKPVAARLRSLLEENPSRASCSLLMTGHSAGGAVANLLYAHMLSETIETELNILTGCFKRIHCITFGTPPISLLPIQKPADNRFRKSVFLSIINEGDPVPRADKAYIRSLLNLYSTPSPSPPTPVTKPIQSNPIKPWKRCKAAKRPPAPVSPMASAIWKVPPATLSNAGRLVLLRRLTDCSARSNNHNGHEEESNIVACVTTDEELRGVVFGDPVMHMMKVYARRIKILATNVVLGREL